MTGSPVENFLWFLFALLLVLAIVVTTPKGTDLVGYNQQQIELNLVPCNTDSECLELNPNKGDY